jgi:hypothetical protein
VYNKYVIKRKKEVIKMFEIIMVIDGNEYKYGADSNKDRANEIAMRVRVERDVDVFVRER